MVPVKQNRIGQYIKEHTSNSLLLRCFCFFLFNEKSYLAGTDVENLSKARKDMKHIAAQGFCLQKNVDILQSFLGGLEWLQGREFTKITHPIFHDNISILGISLGILTMEPTEAREKSVRWLQTILQRKKAINDSFSKTVEFTLNDSSKDAMTNDIPVEFALFVNFICGFPNKGNTKVSKYFLDLRKKEFPYIEDDFFLNMIHLHNEEKILAEYILNQEELQEQIARTTEQANSELLSSLNQVLLSRANVFAEWMLILYFSVIIVTFSIVIYYVLTGDWNYLEPRSFLFGLPVVTYLLQLIYTLIKHKELSLKPVLIFDKVRDWKFKQLTAEFGVKYSNEN